MIYVNGKSVALIYLGERAVSSIRKGTSLVWQAVRSCFGAGYWRGDKPWVGEDAWKN